ncbi:hypothetical protein HMPREF0297_0462, partial [Corynebacterium jeikeium ATCC 43734]
GFQLGEVEKDLFQFAFGHCGGGLLHALLVLGHGEPTVGKVLAKRADSVATVDIGDADFTAGRFVHTSKVAVDA